MALIDSYAAAQDPRVIAQVTAAIYQYASVVAAEGTTVTGHTLRATFATKVVSGQTDLTEYIIEAVVFATLTSTSTDTVVGNAVASQWNLWAGNI